MHNCPNTSLIKFAYDSSLLVPILKNIRDETPRAIQQLKDWSNAKSMPGNDDKSKELLFVKKGSANAVTLVERYVKILGSTFEPTSRFKIHVKDKLVKANKCLLVIRNLRKGGYSQNEIDHLFKSLVLSQLTYALSIYTGSPLELTLVQNFLTRCYKRNYISSHINIYSLLERFDRTIFNRIRKRTNHPLGEICPKTKPYTLKLRKQEAQWPTISTERSKHSSINRCIFKYNLSV